MIMGYNGNNRKLRSDMFPKKKLRKINKKDIDFGLGLLSAPIALFLMLVEISPELEKAALFIDTRTKKFRNLIISKGLLYWMIFLNLVLYLLSYLFGSYILLLVGLVLSFLLIASCKIFIMSLLMVLLIVVLSIYMLQ